MTQLSTLQKRHTKMVALLVQYASLLGYDATWGDAYRDPRVFGEYGKTTEDSYAAVYSEHKRRLAVDLNLFGKMGYLRGEKATEAHNKLHDLWDLMGGDPRKPKDLNHYQYTQARRS